MNSLTTHYRRSQLIALPVPKLNSSWEPIYQVTFPDGSTDVLSQEDIRPDAWHVRLVIWYPEPVNIAPVLWHV